MKLYVDEAKKVTPTILKLRMSGEQILPDFRPGQFVNFNFRDHQGRFRRSYSIGTPPGQTSWEFYIALVENGRGARQLLNLTPGDTVQVTPPTGIFTLRPMTKSRLVAIATSTGIVPFRAMWPQFEKFLANGKKISLLYGVRTARDLLFEDKWYDLLRRYEYFEFIPCFSRPKSPKECQRFGAIHGRVQLALKRLPLIGADNRYLLCGNPDMVEQTEALLVDSGIDLGDILVESYESL